MQNPIDRWLDRTCSHLRTPRHRAAVRRELQAHLDDRIRLLRTQGMTEEQAAEQATLAMGDPDELGRALSEAYRPMRRFACTVITLVIWLVIVALGLHLLYCALSGV